jgi:hypothetical protein
MPSQAAHLAIAQHNQELIDHLLGELSRFSDWITTIAFYRALHLVEAVFAADPNVRHGGDHGKRQELLKRDRRYSQLYKAYHPLWSAAIVARYLEDKESEKEYSTFSKYMTPDDVKTIVLNHYLRRIESSVEQLLGRSIAPASK